MVQFLTDIERFGHSDDKITLAEAYRINWSDSKPVEH